MPLYIAIGETGVPDAGDKYVVPIREVHHVFTANDDEDAGKKIPELQWTDVFYLYKIETSIPIPRRT